MQGHYYPELTQFINYLRYEKRGSEHTTISYENDLKQFTTFMYCEYGVRKLVKIPEAAIRLYFRNTKSEGISDKTISRQKSAIRRFFTYLVRVGAIKVSPMQSFDLEEYKKKKKGTKQKRLPKAITTIDLPTQLRAAECPDTFKDHTDKLIITVLYQTGIRNAELVALTESGVDLTNSCIKVMGKGGKERMIPISSQMVDDLKSYLFLKKETIKTETTTLFTLKNGQPLYPKYVYSVVRKALAPITTQHVTPHTLRHTFASHLIRNGAPMIAIKSLLGHASLASTAIYTGVNIEHLIAAHTKAHPKA